MSLQAEKKTPQPAPPNRTELIIPDGEGFRGYNPAENDYFPDPIYYDKFVKTQVEIQVMVDKFSKAVNMIATLKKLIILVEVNGATKTVQLLILQHFVREYLPEVWSTLSSKQTADELFSELVSTNSSNSESRKLRAAITRITRKPNTGAGPALN